MGCGYSSLKGEDIGDITADPSQRRQHSWKESWHMEEEEDRGDEGGRARALSFTDGNDLEYTTTGDAGPEAPPEVKGRAAVMAKMRSGAARASQAAAQVTSRPSKAPPVERHRPPPTTQELRGMFGHRAQATEEELKGFFGATRADLQRRGEELHRRDEAERTASRARRKKEIDSLIHVGGIY